MALGYIVDGSHYEWDYLSWPEWISWRWFETHFPEKHEFFVTHDISSFQLYHSIILEICLNTQELSLLLDEATCTHGGVDSHDQPRV